MTQEPVINIDDVDSLAHVTGQPEPHKVIFDFLNNPDKKCLLINSLNARDSEYTKVNDSIDKAVELRTNVFKTIGKERKCALLGLRTGRPKAIKELERDNFVVLYHSVFAMSAWASQLIISNFKANIFKDHRLKLIIITRSNLFDEVKHTVLNYLEEDRLQMMTAMQ